MTSDQRIIDALESIAAALNSHDGRALLRRGEFTIPLLVESFIRDSKESQMFLVDWSIDRPPTEASEIRGLLIEVNGHENPLTTASIDLLTTPWLLPASVRLPIRNGHLSTVVRFPLPQISINGRDINARLDVRGFLAGDISISSIGYKP